MQKVHNVLPLQNIITEPRKAFASLGEILELVKNKLQNAISTGLGINTHIATK